MFLFKDYTHDLNSKIFYDAQSSVTINQILTLPLTVLSFSNTCPRNPGRPLE